VRLTSRGADTRDALRPSLALRGTASPGSWFAAGISASLAPFDETAPLIANRISTAGAEADFSVNFPHQVTLGLGGGWARVEGGRVPNERLASSASLRLSPRRNWTVSLMARTMAWDTTGRLDGYFAPQAFRFGEAGLRRTFGRNTRWEGSFVDAGVGHQSLRFGRDGVSRSNGANRVSGALRFSPRPGFSVEGGGGFSSVASPFAEEAAEYSYRWWSLRGRLLVF
jgi:hypothetical protein